MLLLTILIIITSFSLPCYPSTVLTSKYDHSKYISYNPHKYLYKSYPNNYDKIFLDDNYDPSSDIEIP